MVSSPAQAPQTLDTGLACLLIATQYCGLPAVADQRTHQFGAPGQPWRETELLHAAKHLGWPSFLHY
jgi:hypothetical protein